LTEIVERVAEEREVPNESGLCWCGCGRQTGIAKTVQRSGGVLLYRPGDHKRFLPGHANSLRRNRTPRMKSYSAIRSAWLMSVNPTGWLGHGSFSGLLSRLSDMHKRAGRKRWNCVRSS